MAKLPPRLAPLLFAVLMGMVMTFIITCLVTLVNTGGGDGFIQRWMRAFVLAWPSATVCILIFGHRVRRIVRRLTAT